MAVDLTWSSPTAAQASSGLALVTGDILTQTSWQATVSNIYLLSQLAQGPGQLQYVSSTSIRFRAVNGSVIRIAGALYNLTADITASNTNIYIDGASGSSLGASTLYYVYLFLVGSTLTIDFSTTAYAIDSTSGNYGTYIKSGVASRTLIGMIRTNGSSQFVDSATQRFTRSWFNDPLLHVQYLFSTSRSTTSTSHVATNAADIVEWINWSSERVLLRFGGNASNDTAGSRVHVGIGIDSATPISGTARSIVCPTGGQQFGVFTEIAQTPAEGYHYANATFMANANTASIVYSDDQSEPCLEAILCGRQ